MTRVLVTGGAGFLGSVVAAALAREKNVEAVIAGDIREPKELPPGVQFARCDVTEASSIEAILVAHRIDTVVHLAAIVNPGHDVALEYRVDVEGTAHLLAACVAAGVGRIVVSSSGAAYGYHADSPTWIDEEVPLRGNDEFAYSRHKRLVEEMLARYRADHPSLSQTIFRIGTILGPTVKNQITALWDGKRILHIAGSDSPFVFVWVDDVAEAMVRAAMGGEPGIYNVAGDGALTVPEIARRLGKPLLTLPACMLTAALWLGRSLKITEHGPEKVRFLRYRPALANGLLKTKFGFTPSRTSSEAFDAYLATHPEVVARARA